MKWGYMITIIEPGKEKPLVLSYKNAKTAWKVYQHFKRKYWESNLTIILAKNTRIIEIKFPPETFEPIIIDTQLYDDSSYDSLRNS